MLTETRADIIIETLKPDNPTCIGLFCSYARGEENEKNDIDLMYEFNGATFRLFD